MNRVPPDQLKPEHSPSTLQARAEDLADRIGPISTRKDRMRIISLWLAVNVPQKLSESSVTFISDPNDTAL